MLQDVKQASTDDAGNQDDKREIADGCLWWHLYRALRPAIFPHRLGRRANAAIAVKPAQFVPQARAACQHCKGKENTKRRKRKKDPVAGHEVDKITQIWE